MPPARILRFPLTSDAYPRRPSQAELERVFVSPELGAMPKGIVRGMFLGPADSPAAARMHVRVLDALMFRAVKWGIDLDACRWWFEDPRLAVGHFRIVEGASRWRETRVYQLHNDVSRLPVRGMLYDEIKVLGDGRVLGLGGIDAPRGEGDHFFFELVPLVKGVRG